MTTRKLTRMHRRFGLVGALLLVAGGAVAQTSDPPTAFEIVIDSGTVSGPALIGLGHPVPTASSNPAPGPRFRSVAAIRSRVAQLAATYPDAIRTRELDPSTKGAPITAVRISDLDEVRDDGSPEPVMLISGGVHAREWISPELVLRLVERFAQGYSADRDDAIEFLVNNLDIYVIPVLNPDGVAYSQSAPNRSVGYRDAQGALVEPGSDGRLFRKSLAGHDDTLFTPFDKVVPIPAQFGGGGHTFEGLLGVDLNRNSETGYASTNGYPANSPDPRSEVFHGRAAQSGSYSLQDAEPETQALRELVDELEGRLVAYADVHSFGRLVILQRTGDAQRDDAADAVRTQMLATTSGYTPEDYDPGEVTGTLDALVGFRSRQPVSYTIELPPTLPSVPLAGFVLDAAEVETTAAGAIPMFEALADFAAGPAYLRKVVVWQDRPEGAAAADGRIDPLEIVYEAQWDPDPADSARRLLAVRQKRSLEPGPARVQLVFSEPMKLDDGSGNALEVDGSPAQPPGTVAIRMPVTGTLVQVSAVSGSGWLGTRDTPDADGLEPGYERYRFDTWEGGFTWSPPAAGVVGSPGLEVGATDLFGNALDGKPDTVARWNRAWVTFEDDAGGDGQGGVDRLQVFEIDTAPPSITITVDQPATGFPGQND